MEAILIAPCGFNCAVCAQHQKAKKPCPGCRVRTTRKSGLCVMKNCANPARAGADSCAGCAAMPCRRLREFDRRYRRISGGRLRIIGNLQAIARLGMEGFLAQEQRKWTCPACGALLCVSSSLCPACGAALPEAGEQDEADRALPRADASADGGKDR